MANLRQLGLATSLLLLWLEPAAAREPISGMSGDLGYRFQAEGGKAWCGPAVDITLTAKKPEIFTPSRALEQTFGRLRAAITATTECPMTQTIRITARVNDQIVRTAEMARIARWVVVWNNPETKIPDCPVEFAGRPCEPLARAYLLMRRVLDTSALQGAQLVGFLDPNRDTLLDWKTSVAIGSVRWIRDPNTPPEGTAPILLDAAMMRVERECLARGSRFESRSRTELSRDHVAQTYWCREGSSKPEAFIVFVRDNGLYLISVKAKNAEHAALDETIRILNKQFSSSLVM